ncbi:MAG: LTA synthase family protein [Campylobacterales bacterium]|nr:LTA synthase family protein [Campylobacterales bacterium]
MRNRYIQTLSALFLSLFVMMAIRIFFLLRYPEDFSELSALELFQTLFMGLRIDIITLFTFSGIFILLLTLPLAILNKTKTRQAISLMWASVLVVIAMVSLGDILYFEFSRRHLSNEVFNLGNDTDLIFGMAFGSFLFYTLGALLLSALLLYLFTRLFRHLPKPVHSPKKAWALSLLVLLLLVIGIRGSITGSKSIGVADAFAVNKVCSGNLALNGFFCVYRSSKKDKSHILMDTPEAIRITQELLSTPNAPFVDEQYPLMRSYKTPQAKPYNVVIVLLEGMGAEHLDGFTRYPELNVTPYLKELSEKSLKFNRFYSNGYRSIFGITSVYTGISLPSGFDYLGKGLELSNLSYLGHIAKNNGYNTLAMQGANRRSYRVDAVSHLAGFEQFYGAEDMPNVEEVEEGREPGTGTYDHNLLQFYHQKLNTLKEPFLGFTFTSTTHSDFHLPSSQYERYPHDLRNYNGYLNALIYTDSALKRFMQKCEKEPWFDNTIFVFTSDHGSGDAANPIGKKLRGEFASLASVEHFRIPLMIYAPKIFKAQESETLGSHVDIFPTIADLLGWKGEFSVLGNSLFDEKVNKRFVLFNGGQVAGMIRPEGYLIYNYKDIVETNASDPENMLRQLKAVSTAQAHLIQTNRWSKP